MAEETMDKATLDELNEFEKKRPTRRGRRGAAATTQAVEADITEETATPVDPHEQELTEKFGPVDPNMRKIADAKLIGVDIADLMSKNIDFGETISEEEKEAADKWLILSFEHKSELADPDDPHAIETLTVSLNSCKLENPDEEDKDKRNYVFDENKKKYNDELIDYVFGEKFDCHNMRELYVKMDELLSEKGEIPLPIYSSTFKDKNGAYIVVYKLINRHKSGGFIQTTKFTEQEFMAAVAAYNKLPVTIDHIEDINKTVTSKDGKTYKFAQISVICKYKDNFYDVKYSYLHNQEGKKWIKDPDKQYADYTKKSKHIVELANQLGLNANKPLKEVLKDILNVKNKEAYIKIRLAPNEKSYYGKLNNK